MNVKQTNTRKACGTLHDTVYVQPWTLLLLVKQFLSKLKYLVSNLGISFHFYQTFECCDTNIWALRHFPGLFSCHIQFFSSSNLLKLYYFGSPNRQTSANENHKLTP